MVTDMVMDIITGIVGLLAFAGLVAALAILLNDVFDQNDSNNSEETR